MRSKKPHPSPKVLSNTPPKPSPLLSNKAWLFILCTAALATHFISLFSGFVWDDVLFLEVWLPRFDSLQRIFFPPSNIEYWPPSYYRPLGVLSLKIDQLVFGQNAIAWHIHNLLLHTIVCVQLYYLSRRLLANHPQGENIARIASFLFAVHPIHVENVNWIAGRSDPLAVIFILLTITASLNFVAHGRLRSLALIAFSLFVGLLFKELAITAVPLAVLCILLTQEKLLSNNPLRVQLSHTLRLKATWQLFTAYILPIMAYAALRLSASATHGQTSHALTFESLSVVIRCIAYYLVQFFLIKPQMIGPPIDFAPSLFISLILFGALSAFLYFAFRRRSNQFTLVHFACAWFFIALGPSLLVPALDLDVTVLYERYLYLPSIGLCLGIAAAVAFVMTIAKSDRWIVGGISVLGLLCILKANVYGAYWKDNLVIWKHNLSIVPNHVVSWTMLGLEYHRRGMPLERLEAAKTALNATDPSHRLHYGLLINVAVAAREAGDYALAESTSQRAIQLSDSTPEAWIELGLCCLKRNDHQLAEQHFEKALQLKPYSSEAMINLAYIKPDGSEEQMELLQSAIALDPYNAMAFNNLGIVFAERKERDKAIFCFEEALRLDPKIKMARDNLAFLRRAAR